MLHKIPAEKFNVFTHENFSYYLTLFLVWSIFPVGITSPPIFQRLLMGRSAKQLRDQYLIAAAFDPTFRSVIMLIGLAAAALYPTIQAKDVIPHIVHELLPTGIKGLAISGLLAVVMSTADSYLHAAGLLLAHDVIKPLRDRVGLPINELRWARFGTLLIGIIAIAVALRAENLLRLSFTALSFTGPLLLVPLIAGIIGVKTSSRSFYVAMSVTLITFLTAMVMLPTSHRHLVVLISILANGASFFIAHFIENGGLMMAQRTIRKKPMRRPVETPIFSANRLLRYSQQKVAQYGAPYALFGTFCCISYTLPYFMWTYQPPQQYTLMITIRIIAAVACGLLIVHEKWPLTWKPYLPTFWHLTLLYCLPFMNTIMLLLTQGSFEWVINTTMVIIFLVLVVDWETFIGLCVLGISLGVLCYGYIVGNYRIYLAFEARYLMVYQVVFATLIGLLFGRRKQKQLESLMSQSAQLAMDHEEIQNELFEATEEKFRFMHFLKKAGIEQLGSLGHMSKELLSKSKQGVHNAFTAPLQQLTDQLVPMALNMDRFVHRTTEFLRLTDVRVLPIGELTASLVQMYLGQNHKPEVKVLTQKESIQCDVRRIRKMIRNSAIVLRIATENAAPWLVAIEDTQLGYPIRTLGSHRVQRVDALRFVFTNAPEFPKREALYIAHVDEVDTMRPMIPTDMPLLANERIVKAHYGYSNTMTRGEVLTLIYVLPTRLREVRSEDMDALQMLGGAEWPRADDTFPGAQEKEQALLHAVKEKTNIDLSLVNKAIDLIKDYHGPMMRKSGEPFYLHPIAVAAIVLSYNTEEATVLGALLHDTVEDTPLTLEQIELLFNKEVRDIVSGVTHMESNKNTIHKVLLSHPENMHRLWETADPRVLYVKLADRLHNMRTIAVESQESQRRTAEETLLFFVPIAKYLGTETLAKELKERCFSILDKSS